jgi:hypothetical protein
MKAAKLEKEPGFFPLMPMKSSWNSSSFKGPRKASHYLLSSILDRGSTNPSLGSEAVERNKKP